MVYLGGGCGLQVCKTECKDSAPKVGETKMATLIRSISRFLGGSFLVHWPGLTVEVYQDGSHLMAGKVNAVLTLGVWQMLQKTVSGLTFASFPPLLVF